MSITAIETSYAGCRFRSRLEARWAVFFDALGIIWDHEPEGFETSAGRYLPDFRIEVPSDVGYPYWFEVKPLGSASDRRHAALARESGMPLVVARGLPRDYRDQMRREHSALTVHQVEATLIEDEECITLDIWHSAAFVGREQGFHERWNGEFGYLDRYHSGLFVDPYNMIHKGRTWAYDTNGEAHLALYTQGLFPPPDSPDVDRAYAAARSARFDT